VTGAGVVARPGPPPVRGRRPRGHVRGAQATKHSGKHFPKCGTQGHGERKQPETRTLICGFFVAPRGVRGEAKPSVNVAVGFDGVAPRGVRGGSEKDNKGSSNSSWHPRVREERFVTNFPQREVVTMGKLSAQPAKTPRRAATNISTRRTEAIAMTTKTRTRPRPDEPVAVGYGPPCPLLCAAGLGGVCVLCGAKSTRGQAPAGQREPPHQDGDGCERKGQHGSIVELASNAAVAYPWRLWTGQPERVGNEWPECSANCSAGAGQAAKCYDVWILFGSPVDSGATAGILMLVGEV
jgi:hypothetical protein